MRADEMFEARVVTGAGRRRPMRQQVFNYHHSNDIFRASPYWTTVTPSDEWQATTDKAIKNDKGIDQPVFRYGDLTVVRHVPDWGKGVYSILANTKAEADAAMRAHIKAQWVEDIYPKEWFADSVTEARVLPGAGRKIHRERLFLLKTGHGLDYPATLVDMGPVTREQWLGFRPDARPVNDDDTARLLPYTGEWFARGLDFDTAIERLRSAMTTGDLLDDVRRVRGGHDDKVSGIQIVVDGRATDVDVYHNPDKETVTRLLANGPLYAIVSLAKSSELYVWQDKRLTHHEAAAHAKITWPTNMMLYPNGVRVVVDVRGIPNPREWRGNRRVAQWWKEMVVHLESVEPLTAIYGPKLRIAPLTSDRLIEAKIVLGAGRHRPSLAIYVYSAHFGRNEFKVTKRRYTHAEWEALPGVPIHTHSIKDNSNQEGDMYVKAPSREYADKYIVSYFGGDPQTVIQSFPGWLKSPVVTEAKIVSGVGRQRPNRPVFYKFMANLSYEDFSITAYLDSNERWDSLDGRRLGHNAFVYRSGGKGGYVVFVRENDLEKARTMALHLMGELGWNAPDVSFEPWKTMQPTLDREATTL